MAGVEIRTYDWDGIVTGVAADVYDGKKLLHSEFPPLAVKRCRLWLVRHGRWPFVPVRKGQTGTTGPAGSAGAT